MPAYDEDFDTRALYAAQFDEDCSCMQCGDEAPRWQMPNGICSACSELNASAETE